MTRPRPALVVALVSAIGLVIAAILIGRSQWQAWDDANVSTVGARPTMSVPASASPEVAPSPSTAPSSSVSTPSTSSASSRPVPEPVYAVPRRVVVPAIDVDARVVPVGLDENDALEIPDDIRIVGWYELGVPPGADRGSAVLVAHRDGREQGRGVFYDLGRVDVGDRIRVRNDADELLEYVVVARESIRKQGLPYEEIFAVDGPPRLTLISCGGYYDPSNGGYQDNIVVTAVPA